MTSEVPEPDATDDPIAAWDEEIESLRGATERWERDRLGWALVEKGEALRDLGRSGEALSAFGEVIERLDGSSESVLRLRVAIALACKAGALGDLDRQAEALTVCNDFISRFGNTTDETVKPHLVSVLNRKAATLIRLKRHEDAIRVVDDLLQRFHGAPERPIRDLLGSALYNKGISLTSLGRFPEAVAVYDEMLQMSDSDPMRVSLALQNKGWLLRKLYRWEGANQTYGELVDRFAGATDCRLRGRVADALRRRAAMLVVLGREREAEAAWDVLTMRFADQLPRRAILYVRCLRVVISSFFVIGRTASAAGRLTRRRPT